MVYACRSQKITIKIWERLSTTTILQAVIKALRDKIRKIAYLFAYITVSQTANLKMETKWPLKSLKVENFYTTEIRKF